MATHTQTLKTINIAKDFSAFPAGRTSRDSEFNGTSFRENLLVPALNNYHRVIVTFDGVYPVGASFLEESFGGLISREGFSADELEERLEITATDPDLTEYADLSREFIQSAIPQEK